MGARKTLLILSLVLLSSACKHPLAIRGEGDITELGGSGRGCTLEQFQANDPACTDNEVVTDYSVTYEAAPREGWKFVGWEGSCNQNSTPPYCELQTAAAWVGWWDANYPDVVVPATTAVFERDTPHNFVYLLDTLNRQVSVISADTHELVKNIRVGKNPVDLIASPNRRYLYTADEDHDTVTVIETETHSVVAAVGVGYKPDQLLASPDGKKVYVAHSSSRNDPEIWIISTEDNSIAGTIDLDHPSVFGGGTNGFSGFDPDGKFFYAIGPANGQISKISAETDTPTNVIDFLFGDLSSEDYYFDRLVMSPDGKQLYALSRSTYLMPVISTESDQLLNEVRLDLDDGEAYRDHPFSPDGSTLYRNGFYQVSVVSTETHLETAVFNIGSRSSPRIVIDEAKQLMYVGTGISTGIVDDYISIISTEQNIVTHTIHLDKNYLGDDYVPANRTVPLIELSELALTPDGQYLYALIDNPRQILVIDTSDYRIEHVIEGINGGEFFTFP